LVEEKNFERAAARLGIAQPGLSQQILALESVVGISLLDRRRRSVHLTASGLLLFEDAQKILAQADATIMALHRAGRGQTGRISIGYVASAAYSGLFTKSLASFRAAYPEVELQLVEMEMRQQLSKISEGELDFGYIRPPAPIPEGLTTAIILKEPLVVVLSENHPLAHRSQIDLLDLSEATFITPRQPPETGFHSNTIEACEEAGFSPSISAVGRDFTTIASMVAVGLGLALVPASMRCLQLPGVRYVSLAESRTTSNLAVAYRRAETSATVRAFISLIARPR
jgi:DNA-binding transcriptional LysR family regulator